MRSQYIVFGVLAVLVCSSGTTTAQTKNPLLNQAIKLHAEAKVQDAIGLYRRVAAESAEPGEVRHARFAIAACLLSLKDYDGAVVEFEAYAKQFPDDGNGPLALVHAGNARAEQGRMQDAETYYQRALAIQQDENNRRVWTGWAHLGMGQVLVAKKDYAGALPHLAQAIEQAPEDLVTDKAVTLLLSSFSAIEKSGGSAIAGNAIAQANLALGRLYHDQEKHAQALPYLNRAIVEATDGALLSDSYIMLGESLVGVQREKEALRAFQAVKQIADKSPAFQQKRAHFVGVAAIDEAIVLSMFGRGAEGARLCDDTLAMCTKAGFGVEDWVIKELKRARAACVPTPEAQ